MTQLICLIALNILLNKTKNVNVDINLSTTEHAFAERCERCIYNCCEYDTKNMMIDKDKHTVRNWRN